MLKNLLRWFLPRQARVEGITLDGRERIVAKVTYTGQYNESDIIRQAILKAAEEGIALRDVRVLDSEVFV